MRPNRLFPILILFTASGTVFGQAMKSPGIPHSTTPVLPLTPPPTPAPRVGPPEPVAPPAPTPTPRPKPKAATTKPKSTAASKPAAGSKPDPSSPARSPASKPVAVKEAEPEPKPVAVKAAEPEPKPVAVKAAEPEPKPVALKAAEPEPKPVVVKEAAPAPKPVVVKEAAPAPKPVVVKEAAPAPRPMVVKESSRELVEIGGGAPAAESYAGGDSASFRAGDTFELRLSGMPPEDAQPFSLQFTIGSDGYVNIPLGGLVKASGLSQSQLERAIEKRLMDQQIFTRPTATINVAPQSRFVTIGGQVRIPQRLSWAADLTLLSAISAVGGPADFAGSKIKLTRGGKVQYFLKKELDRHPEKDPRLLPGDQVEQL
jgi:protein involved in polysaccharide export with SLBB domain